MTKLIFPLAATGAWPAASPRCPGPHGQSSDRVNEIIVYGNDPCRADR